MLGAGSWCRTYCMAHQSNVRNMSFSVLMAPMSFLHRRTSTGIAAHPEGRPLIISQHINNTCGTEMSPIPPKQYAIEKDKS
ncbi:hypothetical protein PoB_001954300 [Plakobranchus ocellatus]|uniref:Uncharacterized protein n=1 Tax=Plakobranchus ocellatus TaxID=259542 RepID=A0AAV3ZF00_9GAST|nr:hypothetical protein PoB_001954300 [Plakobranchus ocellatus]